MANTPERKRPRLRSKGLVVDPTTTLDLSNIQPLLPLESKGRELWDYLAADPPFWLTEADVPMVAVWCAATDAVKAALSTVPIGKNGDHELPAASVAQQAAIIKEWRALADQLGMTPTSRSRLKLTEAQAVTAARRAQALGEDNDHAAPIDIADLLDDAS